MTMIKITAALLVALLLAACETTGATHPRLDALDTGLTHPCADPVPKPPGPIDEAETIDRWGKDRIELRDCGRRFGEYVRITEGRDAGLAGR